MLKNTTIYSIDGDWFKITNVEVSIENKKVCVTFYGYNKDKDDEYITKDDFEFRLNNGWFLVNDFVKFAYGRKLFLTFQELPINAHEQVKLGFEFEATKLRNETTSDFMNNVYKRLFD